MSGGSFFFSLSLLLSNRDRTEFDGSSAVSRLIYRNILAGQQAPS